MGTIADYDVTKPDGATEAVATLDDYLKEVKVAVKTSFEIEHRAQGEHQYPKSGNIAARPVFGVANRLYNNTETKTIQRDTGSAWEDLVHYYTRVKIGTFTGDGSSNRAITGIGFAPTWVDVVPLTGSNPAFSKGTNFGAGNSHKWSDNTTATDGIDTLDADGFTVDAGANVNTVVYQFKAYRDRA